MAPPQDHHWIQKFYAGLKAYEDAAFPKTCRSCGRVYHSADEFFRDTTAVNRVSGLIEYEDEDGAPVVSLYRNCECGSTLLAEFQDRRDMTETGQRRRDQFDRLLDQLKQRGLTEETARTELRKLLRGRRSDILEALGITPPERDAE